MDHAELQEEYCILFNTITDSLIQLEEIVSRLKDAQRDAEEIYISAGSADRLCLFVNNKKKPVND